MVGLKKMMTLVQVVLLADVDMVPTLDMSVNLQKPKKFKALLERLESGYVISLPVMAVANNHTREFTLEMATTMVEGMYPFLLKQSCQFSESSISRELGCLQHILTDILVYLSWHIKSVTVEALLVKAK